MRTAVVSAASLTLLMARGSAVPPGSAVAEEWHLAQRLSRAIALQATEVNTTLTAVPGIKVGHHTLTERPTGCTAILVEGGAVAGIDVRGSAPATAETDLLKPTNTVEQVHAISLSGGSAFGLDSRSGIVRYLDERNVGFKAFGNINVPIVPAASLIDLNVGGSPKIRPTAECGYLAARAASTAPVVEGNVGAGAGATVGKTAGFSRAMKGGLGSAALRMPDGLIVAAIVAVNAAGDIIDPATGKIVAGARTPDGKSFADARVLLRTGAAQPPRIGENTTIGVVATNAALTKTQATKVAEMAQDGYARSIFPSHTMGDGDTIFALATGTLAPTAGAAASPSNMTATGAGQAGRGPGTMSTTSDVSRIGSLAAMVMAQAVLRAVQQATGIPGYPAARDMAK
jgi:L-aminopeptidase/D-esterase-like protein